MFTARCTNSDGSQSNDDNSDQCVGDKKTIYAKFELGPCVFYSCNKGNNKKYGTLQAAVDGYFMRQKVQ